MLIFVPFVLGSEEEKPTVKVPHTVKAVPLKATGHAKPQTSSEEDSSSDDDDDTPRKYNSFQLRM